MSLLKSKIKKMGHWACLGDMMGQTYHIYAYSGTNHTT